ncbi:MAG: GNAT family N-acetyltransferase [Candidatus ainarchaeum sp.]|nr:GNAT family N-acetyltransferase [Candidatus ainarchaeum sp.]
MSDGKARHGKKEEICPEERPFLHRKSKKERISTERPLLLGQDFSIVKLGGSNVPSSHRTAAKEGKERGEKVFQGMMKLLKECFPPSEIESESQYREYFFDENSENWKVNVAVDKSGKAIGVSLYSISPEMDLIMYNIVAVSPEHRHRGVARELVSSMLDSSGSAAYVMGEIEQPDPSLSGEEARMRNIVRPAFHDSISKLRAIRLEDGSPLIYLLPIMASEEERQEAANSGEPLEPEPLMLCLRPLKSHERNGIPSQEAGKMLLWFFKDYLEAECSDVRPSEVNELLSQSFAKLAPGTDAQEFRRLLDGGRQNDAAILGMIPGTQLRFMKISECSK